MNQTAWVNLIAGAAITLSAVGGASADTQVNGGSSDEVRAIVAEMMADAQSRSSLLQGGGTAGYDNSNFFLASGDGNFRLNISGEVQFRYYLNFRDDNGGEDDFEPGFQTKRTALNFEGHVLDPNLFYRVSGNFGFGSDDSSFNLEDAFVGYNFENGFSLRWGQFRLPFMREELVTEVHQLAVDKSLFNSVFNQGRGQGVELSYTEEDWKLYVAFSDGFRSANSDIDDDKTLGANSLFASGESDYAFTARFEYKFAGEWQQFKDFTSPSGSDFAAMLGLAAHYEGGDRTTADFAPVASDNSYDYFAWTGDVSLEGDGWNLYAAGTGSYIDFTGGLSSSDYGFVIQGGIMIPETSWEVFARYDALVPDDEERGLDSDDDWFSTVTAGVNYYWHGHAAKFTADVVWFIDDFNALATTDSGIGYLGDNDENEIALRFQFQLLF